MIGKLNYRDSGLIYDYITTELKEESSKPLALELLYNNHVYIVGALELEFIRFYKQR
jgi:hypothetical protein